MEGLYTGLVVCWAVVMVEGLYTGLVVCWAVVMGGGTLYWSCSVLGFGGGWRDFILVL